MAAYSIADSILRDDANCQGIWTLDDVYTDSSAQGNTLTSSGSPSFATGKFNNGLDLESSSSQFAYRADNASLSITGDLSITAWINLETLPSANTSVVGKYDTAAGGRSYLFYIDSAAKLHFVFTSDGSSVFSAAVANTALTGADVGTIAHIAVSVDVSAGGSGIVLYKNGSSVAVTVEDTAATSIANSTGDFRIGSFATAGTPGNFFDGIIDDVGIFNRILTPTEIGQIYDGTIPRRVVGGGSPIFFGNTAIA